jgi:hypothetical protein
MTGDLYSKLVCALTHDIRVCDGCMKCEGANSAEIRIKLIEELAKECGKELPFVQEIKD